MILSLFQEPEKSHPRSGLLFQLMTLSRSFLRNARFITCFCAILIACGMGYSEAQAQTAPVTCGAPVLGNETEPALLLWEDCSTGTWTVWAAGGGAATVQTFDGGISANQNATMVAGSRLESNDVLDATDPMNILFMLNVAGPGVDTFDFAFPDTAAVCFDAPGANLLVGPNRSPITPPVDLNTMGPCVSAACGAPAYNKATERGTFLWQGCQSGRWFLRVTAGGQSVDYVGLLDSDQPLVSVTPFSLESGDVLNNSPSNQFDYALHVGGKGEDGVNFSLAAGASACLDTGGSVIVGADRTSVQSPFDIHTLGACSGSNPPPPPPPPNPNPTPNPNPNPNPSGVPYLQDADTTDSVRFFIDTNLRDSNRPFPRITTGPIKQKGTAEQFSKYGVMAVKPGRFDWVKQIKAINPSLAVLRIFAPFEYQGFNEGNPCRQANGMPFGGTGPATANCKVYAGHWLYAPGSTLRNSISATATTLKVADASRFNKGRHVVIYDGGAGAFNNAEHALVTAVNTSTDTLTLAKRAFKSTARSHPAGAIVAEHTIGNGSNQVAENWAYNLSTTCPRDSSGRKMNVVLADWLANNFDKDSKGNPSGLKVEGILFDSDFPFIQASGHGKRPDVNNDLVLDNGLLPNGENLWGNGLEVFYGMLRQRLPNAVQVGGVTESRGYTSLNGTQLEGWPQRSIGSSVPDYRAIDGRLSTYSVQMHHGEVGPRYTEGFNRVSTKLYPYNGDKPNTNAPFRFAFGLILLDDGYFGQQNSEVKDPWWDEYAVDVVPGSPTYGQAIRSTPKDESLIRSHSGWMGFPWGPRHRIYSQTAFAAKNTLIANGGFESGLGPWQGNKVSVKVTTNAADVLKGTKALHISKPNSYVSKVTGATAKGPTVHLTGGVDYTLAFAAKASDIRIIQVAMGNQSELMDIADTWVRRVFTFTAPSTGNYQLKFSVGRESTDVWIDEIYLFKGNADVFRRDFDNAVVVVNATPSARTVDLGGTFERILGTGQDPINNGATVKKVTIGPYDSAILVRP